jgi:Cu(I)/Ag(I) efflux system membrane fusion protein/cobalt-zinc-cadmium efflux system membrane fusion protein
MKETKIPAVATDQYRRAFLITLIAFFVVSGVAVWFWWRSPLNPFATGTGQQPTESTKSPETTQATVNPDNAAPSPTETPLGPIQLSPQRLQSIGVKVGTVESKIVNDEIRAYGNIQTNERRLAFVQVRFAGWIREVYANATGDLIQKGQPLFTIYSPDLIAAEREYLLAKKNAASVRSSQVSGVANGAASLVAASKARLQQLDLPEDEITRLDNTGEAITDLTFRSPVAGYVTEKNALPNQYVQPDTKLFTIGNLSDVWVVAQIFQNDAGKIRPGNTAQITLDAYPGEIFRGKVDYLLPQLDTETRTLPVRLVLPNPGFKLRPGMFVNVTVKRPLGRQLLIPDSGVFHSGTRNLIFTYAGEGNIESREVELGPHVGAEFVITKGLKAGEQIVTSANFLIDSEAQLQAAAGAFTPPPPVVGQAPSVNTPSQALSNAELTTDPSPPQKGSNTFRIRLNDQEGKPIVGAQVSVTFFMAAMPAMGMAAMRTVMQASDKGDGVYEGSVTLGSAGSWQVTITAQSKGQTIVNKQLTVNTTGGI